MATTQQVIEMDGKEYPIFPPALIPPELLEDWTEARKRYEEVQATPFYLKEDAIWAAVTDISGELINELLADREDCWYSYADAVSLLLNTEAYAMTPVDLMGATRHGTHIAVATDGSGPLWFFRDAYGRKAIIRADTFESAFEIVEEEVLTPISIEDLPEAYGLWIQETEEGRTEIHDETAGTVLAIFPTWDKKGIQRYVDMLLCDRDLAEGYSYQSNAEGTGIVLHSLHGEQLEPLTADLLTAEEIVLRLDGQIAPVE